ncbi:MAG: PQQ-dependent sugar dehydrogenase [Chloroflexi bacterium]|nr:PQQ-dependent sugar dehydrogenase [Chloroflexota bacterium]
MWSRGACGVTDQLASLPRRAALPVLLMACALLAACEDGEPPPLPVVALEPALGGERFDRPLEVGAYPGGRFFVAEQHGRVWVLGADGSDRRVLLDLGDHIDADLGEGLLSVTLDPDFEHNGYLWAYYFAAGEPPRSVLARFEVAGDTADPATRLEVLVLPQPGYNQNGGAIRFGPDGMLYLSLGDGSASTDPFENGQNLGTLLGSVVRIDVRESSAAQPYAVPADNPFAGVEGARDEIWAYGFRNPWRMAFDPEDGALWLGDVGFIDNEEVNRVGRGANHGWNVLEGFGCLTPGRACDGAGMTPPLMAYGHDAGRCSVTGGVVYRGKALEALRGVYLFGDFCTGDVFALRPPGEDADPASGRTEPVVLVSGAGSLVSFGLDDAGEVLVVDFTGAIWRLTAR